MERGRPAPPFSPVAGRRGTHCPRLRASLQLDRPSFRERAPGRDVRREASALERPERDEWMQTNDGV